MGHLVTQFQGQILRAAANNRVRGHASVCGYAPPLPSVPVLESSVKSGPEKIRSRGSWSHIVSKATDA